MFGLCLTSFNLAAEELSQVEVLKEIGKKGAVVKSYTVTAYTLNEMPMFKALPDEEKLILAKIWYKEPNKLRMEYQDSVCEGLSQKVTHIVNGNIEWLIYEEDGKTDITKFNYEKSAPLTKGKRLFCPTGTDIVHPFIRMQQVNLLGKVIEDNEGYYLFKAIPCWFPGAEMASHIKLWIRIKDGLLTRIGMFEFDGKEFMSQIYKDLKINVDVPDDKFIYTPPKGAEVKNYDFGFSLSN